MSRSIKTPLEDARESAETLHRFGIRITDSHLHVGDNGTRCEFCGKPLEAKVHDPLRLGRGTD